jgi:hypothetical protein
MKKVIDGKVYNTETGTEISRQKSTGRESTLYRTPKGAFFRYVHTIWEGEHNSITPLSTKEAKELYELFDDPRMSWEAAFNETPVEPEPDRGRPPLYAEPMTQTAVMLTQEMIDWLKAQPAGVSATVRSLIENAMEETAETLPLTPDQRAEQEKRIREYLQAPPWKGE